MNSEWLRARGIVAAAVGAGILLGAAGILIYQQLLAERKRLDRIASSVSLLRRELDHLKRCQSTSVCSKCACMLLFLDTNTVNDVAPRNGRQSSRTLSDVDMFSTVSRLDEEEEDSEFFDLSDDEVQDNGDGRHSMRGAGGDSASLNELLEQVDSLLAGGTADEKTLAYHLLEEHKEQGYSNVSVLWRLARAAYSMANISEPEKKKEYMFEGLGHAKNALALDDHNADAHKWYAITLGSCGDFLPLKEKIGNGYVFKQHVDRAISLRPTDHSLYHLLGRFEFEVASLSWLERKLASSLIAAPPEGSYDGARQKFSKAEELSPKEWKENRLFMAKCYAQLGQMAECVEWLDKAAAAPSKTPEDEEADKEVQVLLTKYQSYRS